MTFPTIPAEWAISPHLKDIPATDRDDVLAFMPAWMQDGSVIGIIADGLWEASVKLASKLAAYAATANGEFAEGSQLDFIAAQRGITRGEDEPEEEFRARSLTDEDVITPTALLGAIDRITARYTAKLAYYYERPDDEILICNAASEMGFYLFSNAAKPVNPCVNPWRQRDTRTRCTPRHGLLWEHRIPNYAQAEFFLDSTTSPGYMAPGNSEIYSGTACRQAVVCLPAFGNRRPGVADPTDCTIFSDAVAPAFSSYLFAHATIDTQSGLGRDVGSNVYSSANSIDAVVDAVQALFHTRALAGVAVQIGIDPAI